MSQRRPPKRGNNGAPERFRGAGRGRGRQRQIDMYEAQERFDPQLEPGAPIAPPPPPRKNFGRAGSYD
jgi:hypothetical protein